jgi:CRP/FNR family nitrogen fixation transcriptional regulator
MRGAARTRPEPTPPAIGTVRRFAPRQTIFAEGEPATHCMMVIHGVVRSCSSFADGRRFVGAFYAAGDMFGFEGQPAYPAAAEAVCETALALYPAPDWLELAHAPDNLSRQILGALMSSTEQARGHARLLGRLSAIEKMAAFLLEWRERSNQGMLISLEMPRQDIADHLGLTVETVSRCLAQLKRDGLIGLRSSRHLDLLDVPALRAISG